MKNKVAFVSFATAVLLASCQKDADKISSGGISEERSAQGRQANTVGQVYTMSNDASNNQVLVYDRSASGALSFSASYNTGGNGTGAGLGSQGSVVLSEDNSWLFVVNAGSNTISSFKALGKTLQLVSTVSSGGTMPISLTSFNHWVYVLNAGGSGNIAGFSVGSDGSLHPITGSSRPLSSSTAGPAQVSFVNQGAAVVVTEKAANKIISYTLSAEGIPGDLHSIASANTTPFGFAVGSDGLMYVSEAAGSVPGASTVSAYAVSSTGTITLVDGPVSAGQTSACWVAINNNNKYVYSSNTGSNTVTAFSAKGSLQVLEAAIPTGTAPADQAFSNNSKFLYILNGGSDSISAYSVQNDGSLETIQTVSGLPAAAVGLAAK
jgi:6-phosphogluconolactonase (cycloisomerase 2 family)